MSPIFPWQSQRQSANSKSVASIERVQSAYRTLALILLNSIILFVIINVAAALAFRATPPEKTSPVNPVVQKYDLDRLARVYPGYTKEQIVELLDEIWTGPLQY